MSPSCTADPNVPLTLAMDGRIMHYSYISLSNQLPLCKRQKVLLVKRLAHVSSAIAKLISRIFRDTDTVFISPSHRG